MKNLRRIKEHKEEEESKGKERSLSESFYLAVAKFLLQWENVFLR